MRFIPARLLAIPAVAGTVGYEALRKRFNLSEHSFQDRLDDAKERASDFLASLKSSVPGRRLLEAKTQDDNLSNTIPAPAPTESISTEPTLDPSPPEIEELPGIPPLKDEPDVELLLNGLHKLQDQLAAVTGDHQAEIMSERARLQKEISEIRRQNDQLRVSYMNLRARLTNPSQEITGSHKKSAIELYSDTLDLLKTFRKNSKAQQRLPRIVVVGNPKSGKSSVLEMLAQARIFPRGQGEAMTRAPVQVTLSEGPMRMITFKEGEKKYDLTNQEEVKLLQDEVKARMEASVQEGHTISHEPIQLEMQGPGLPRVIMVDLPGISNSETGVTSDPKDDAIGLVRHHIQDPNAIILCVQDGSVDGENNNATELVASVDPKGLRTIFVMTKMDVVEQQSINTARVRSIMDGRLFRMHTLGYFAVVTGQGDADESIDSIRQYEQSFFQTSSLFRKGVLRPQFTTTENLSRTISQEFWKLVKDGMTSEVEAVKAELANKELEWRSTYKSRFMSRDELFQVGKHEILESVARFDSITPRQWEAMLSNNMFDKFAQRLVEDVYIAAAKSTTTDFQTRVDVQLSDWARRDLSSLCVDIAKDTLMSEFGRVVKTSVISALGENESQLFDHVKEVVVDKCRANHEWSPDAISNLKVIQTNMLEDDEMDAGDWQEACDFMEDKMTEQSAIMKTRLHELFGPEYMEQWAYWRSRNDEQARSSAIRDQLTSYLTTDKLKPHLDHDDVITVRNTLRNSRGQEVTDDQIRKTYDAMYMDAFLEKSIETALYCRSRYQIPEHRLGKVPNNLGCKDIVLFWRIQEMLNSTSRVMRQQIMSQRVRLEEDVKHVLDTIGQDDSAKQTLLAGERVDLADQIENNRHLYHRLAALVRQLNVAPKPPTVV